MNSIVSKNLASGCTMLAEEETTRTKLTKMTMKKILMQAMMTVPILAPMIIMLMVCIYYFKIFPSGERFIFF